MIPDRYLMRPLLTGGACLLLSACTVLGPDYQPPQVKEMAGWQSASESQFKDSPRAADYHRWWTQLNDPVLSALVEEALVKNPDVRIAGLRILEAQAQLGIAESLLGPQATVASGEWLQAGQTRNGHSTSGSSYGAAFNLGWELDFWGKFQRGVEAADANYFATLAQYDDIQVLMIAQVAQLYVSIRTVEARLEIAHENARIQQRSLEITERLFKSGNNAELDVQQAKTQYLGTLSSIPQLETSLRQSQNALSTLLARVPGPLPEMLPGTGVIPQGELALVAEMPADLLRRRPDVRVAERQLAAQSALIGVAETELYPSITLLGTLGVSATGGGSETFSWAAGPAISWDLLDRGRLSNQVLVQDARFQQLHERYRDTVFRAAREVDDSAVAYANGQDEIELLGQTGAAARRSLDIANTQYREGMADFQRVLDSQRALFNQQERLVNSRGARMRDLITLYKALGGGWEQGRQRPLVTPEVDAQFRTNSDWAPLLDATQPQPTAQKVK
ncbi:efflux transporter outer membrane subunit [Aeromonas sp. sif2416]|uniref:efflux transporter outer membrane subunit n=1 Tax=Aeromonas sp. sif2416 TaxID=2854793 RepID=UPI001C486436|nr:efflux transporter outer membrane subunit [Aeromonas sp. sif2416]MBV7436151.1 efflux transporter outer membrane subunit [Aeromonas sp. sif2416]